MTQNIAVLNPLTYPGSVEFKQKLRKYTSWALWYCSFDSCCSFACLLGFGMVGKFGGTTAKNHPYHEIYGSGTAPFYCRFC